MITCFLLLPHVRVKTPTLYVCVLNNCCCQYSLHLNRWLVYFLQKEKRDQLQIRVSDVEAREKEQKAALDTMDKSRNMKSSAVTRRQNELKVSRLTLAPVNPA